MEGIDLQSIRNYGYLPESTLSCIMPVIKLWKTSKILSLKSKLFFALLLVVLVVLLFHSEKKMKC